MFDEEMENSLQGLFVKITHQYFLKNYRQMTALGIHPGQFPTLCLLAHQDGMTQREIAQKLNIQPPTVTVTIQRLEKSGMVCRREDERDRRISRISLTDLGRSTAEQIRAIMRRNEETMFQGFSESETCLLGRFFQQILENVKKIDTDQQEEKTHV